MNKINILQHGNMADPYCLATREHDKLMRGYIVRQLGRTLDK